ncbi:MAG TPA: pitrilysin family protein [Polyangia bacterium]|jgi:zinc protease|nr:pitrilysin family protein [Polyangia bacterium]
MILLLGGSCAALREGGILSVSPRNRPSGHTAGPPQQVAQASLGALTATKWRLPNGLDVILMPDGAATSVSYMTWFRVGSRSEDEAAGETGLAHLFEHLMFTQTKKREAGAFDSSIEAAGGNANAMTYYDFTAYTDDLPPAALELAVQLESDRMVNLDLRKNQVDNERDVVIEERLATVEDNVDGLLDEMVFKQAFRNHPYRWPVMGWMKDIKAFTEKKALAFYKKFYAPNNAVVVITGKFDPVPALELVVAYYGGISPSRNLPTDNAQPERAPDKEVRAAVQHPVPADRLVIGFPAPSFGDADRAAYEVINELLMGGPSSRLYRKLVVDKEIASSVRGEVTPTKDPGLFMLWVQMTKRNTAAEAEALILAEIAQLAVQPPSAAELEKAKARLETAFWRQLDASHGRAELLGEFEVTCNDFRRLFARPAEYEKVSADDVRRVTAAYLGPGARSVVVARPKGDSPGAS